ncbi:ankyrin repeat protein [Acanthamoeba polyphaga mimivirus]|uniref:Ankyrin repeat protein n=2 Tax=Megamimivirinae TaxID=3044648 RepID=A0A2L2DP37_MIMIV|nr:putative ankyrin repeat protein [Megavirus chiliensis]AEQ32948.1 ankyrin repeat protein [Megavirus chiliensis]AVG46794.1 ankyrin repeat protein [Acanthamoeba polyphaga mimivirus]AVG47914.1 ankyrin repeat protein [Acanthamoeba polyphaga mimivirus]
MENFNDKFEYECCPGVKCGGFTELMFMVNNVNNMSSQQLLSMIPFHLLSTCRINKYISYIDTKNELGWTALMIACRNSNITSSNDIVELLLTLGADTTLSNNNSETALILAFKYAGTGSNIDTVKLLLNRWNEIDLCRNYELYFSIAWKNKFHSMELLKILVENYAKSKYKYEIFAQMVKNSRTERNTQILKLLFEHIIDFNYTVLIDCNSTPLMSACRYSSTTSDIETVKLLLEKGADPNYFKKNKHLPIILASSYSQSTSNMETIKLLLEHGANVNAHDINGNTALIMAIKNSNTFSNFETIKYLLDNGADPNIVNKSLVSPLHTAIEIFKDNTNIIELLLEHKADVSALNHKCETPLFLFINKYPMICHDKYKNIIELFIDHGSNIGTQTAYGETILFNLLNIYINKKGQDESLNEIIDIFLIRGIGCNCSENPPLLQLAKHSHEIDMTDIVVKLIKYGADVNLIDRHNQSALSVALKAGGGKNLYFIELLLNFGANISAEYLNTSFMSIIESKNLAIIKLLLDHGIDVNIVDEKNNNCLLRLIHNKIENENDVEIIKLLIEYGVKINFDNGHFSILSEAIDIISDIGSEVVKLLLDNGANPNYIYDNKTVLLEIFEYHDKTTIKNDLINVKKLLNHGANPNLLDESGNNAILLAIKNEFPLEFINLLIDHNANINIIGKENMTALMYAIRPINIKIDYCHQLVNLLLDHNINTHLRNINGRTALIMMAKNLSRGNSFNYTKYHEKLFGYNGIFTRLCEHANFDLLDIYGKTVLAYIDDEIMIDFIKLFRKKCIQDHLIKNLHTEIIDSNLVFMMSPNSIRTRIATIKWYLDQGDTYQELIERDSKLFEYFGINDMDDLHSKINLANKYID